MGPAMSTLHLCMKYPLPNGRVGIIQGDQEISIKCYTEILMLKRRRTIGVKAMNMGSGIKPSGVANKGEEAPL